MTKIGISLRNVIWGYLSKIISLIFPFILRTVIIQKLGAEYLGLDSLFISILQVLSLSELGFGSAMVYSMYKPIAEKKYEDVCALLNFYKKIYRIIGMVILVAGVTLMPFLKFLISGTYPKSINLYVIYIFFLINTVISYFLYAYKVALLNAFQRNDLESKAALIVNLFRYIGQICVVVIFQNYYLYLLVLILSTVFNNMINYLFSIKFFPEYKCVGSISNNKKLEIKTNVIALSLHKFGGTVLNSSDSIVVSAFLGVVEVAKYSNYYYIINSLNTLINVFFNSILGVLGNALVVDSYKKSTNNFKRILLLNTWLTCVGSTMLCTLYQPFMSLWAGNRLLFSNDIAYLFVIYFYIHAIRRTVILFRDAAGKWNDNKWQPVVSGIFNLILNFVLVQIIGIYGILLSTIISMIIIDIPWESKILKGNVVDYSLRSYANNLVINFIMTIISCGISVWITTKLQINYLILSIIFRIVLSFTISNLLLLLVNYKSDEMLFFLNLIRNIIKRRR